jgi:hypothetical protein
VRLTGLTGVSYEVQCLIGLTSHHHRSDRRNTVSSSVRRERVQFGHHAYSPPLRRHQGPFTTSPPTLSVITPQRGGRRAGGARGRTLGHGGHPPTIEAAAPRARLLCRPCRAQCLLCSPPCRSTGHGGSCSRSSPHRQCWSSRVMQADQSLCWRLHKSAVESAWWCRRLPY